MNKIEKSIVLLFAIPSAIAMAYFMWPLLLILWRLFETLDDVTEPQEIFYIMGYTCMGVVGTWGWLELLGHLGVIAL